MNIFLLLEDIHCAVIAAQNLEGGLKQMKSLVLTVALITAVYIVYKEITEY